MAGGGGGSVARRRWSARSSVPASAASTRPTATTQRRRSGSTPGTCSADGTGVIRGEYRYQTLASDADKLVHHVDILAAEVRNASGATAVAYEAAHLFLCYP